MKTSTLTLFLAAFLLGTATSSPTPMNLHKRSLYLLSRQDSPSNSTTSTPSGSQTGTVEPGDTLASIAAATNRGICDIAAANNIPDPNFIQPGMTLIIPPEAPKKDDTSCLGGTQTAAAPTSGEGEPGAKPAPTGEGQKPTPSAPAGETAGEGQSPAPSAPTVTVAATPATEGETPNASPEATPAAEAGKGEKKE